MLVRALTLLLTVILMTGAVTQVCGSPDVASAAVLDDASDLDPAGPEGQLGPCVVAQPLVVPQPDRQLRSTGCAPRSSPSGRMHAIVVFRPPRLVASR